MGKGLADTLQEPHPASALRLVLAICPPREKNPARAHEYLISPCDTSTVVIAVPVLCHQPPSLVKVHTLDIAPLRSESPPQKRSGMTRILEGFHSFTGTPTRSSAIRVSYTCLSLPSYIAGTHLPTLEGWKAKQTLVRSSAGRVANLQPPDCKSGTLPLSH